MADVAARAGVSIATVSRALREVPGVSERTRKQIRVICDELGYVVSPEASRLASRTTGRIAVVLPRLDVWFSSTMLATIEPMLRRAGFDVLIYQLNGDAARTRFLLELPARRKVDAVILTALPMGWDTDRLELMQANVVVVGGRIRDYPYVDVDDYQGARHAVRHLFELGHQRVALVRTSDPSGTVWTSDVLRTDGWRAESKAQGACDIDDLVVTAVAGPNAGAAALDDVVRMPNPPTGVFAYSDDLALGMLSRALELGIRVPEDLSLVGFDGSPAARQFGITTVDQDVAGQAARAAQLALDVLSGVECERHVVVDTELMMGRSTGPPQAPPG